VCRLNRQGLRKELSEKNDETQVGFQAVKGNIMDRIFIRRREYKE
jgi:hypothetical protein